MPVLEKINVAAIFAKAMEDSGVSDELPLGAWDVLVKGALASEKKAYGEETPAVTFRVGLVAPVSGAEVSELALRDHSPMYYDIFIKRLKDLQNALNVLADFGYVTSGTVEEVAAAYLSGKDFLKVLSTALKDAKDAPGTANLSERKYFSKKENHEVRVVEITKLAAAE